MNIVFQCKWLGDPLNRTFDVELDSSDADLLDQNLWHLAAEGFVMAAYDLYAEAWEEKEIVRVEVVHGTGQRRLFDVRQKREVIATVVKEVEPAA